MSEISGFLSGGLTVLIGVEESMLATYIGKMFQLCMLTDFKGKMPFELYYLLFKVATDIS